MQLTQAEDSEVQHRSTVAAGVHDMIFTLKYQAAAFRRCTEPVVFILNIHLSADIVSLTLGKETTDVREICFPS